MIRVLNRYEIQTRRTELDWSYPGAEVWKAIDIERGQDVTVISYSTAEGNGASTTKRRLWSTELRKLIRLSCQPFDPALIGFVNGGFDAEHEMLALVMDPLDLPSVDRWTRTSPDAQACLSQWRGNNGEYRAELWRHVGRLFRALAAIHESRIVHRRIHLATVFVDESSSRDQPGFLKLGRFEASTFFHAARRAKSDSAESLEVDQQWYMPTLSSTDTFGRLLSGTPAGDVYSVLLVALWLLTGRPNPNRDIIRFRQSLIDGDGAHATRRAIIAEAVNSLPSEFERSFFSDVIKPRFSATSLASSYDRRAAAIESHLRQSSVSATGPLCFVVSRSAAEALERLLALRGNATPWADWLSQQLKDARLSLGICDPEQNVWQCQILLPTGWLLKCAIFKPASGIPDWKRLSINVIDEHPRSSYNTSISIRDHELRILTGRAALPPSARSWHGLFDELRMPNESLAPAEQALEFLNLAELAFWEEQVVPVEVTHAKVTWTDNIGAEEIVVRQLIDDPVMRLNPLIRKQHVPDFSLILQDKDAVQVELSTDKRLWDRDNDRTIWLEANFDVRDIPSRDAGEQRSLTMYREGLTRNDTLTQVGQKSWFKTQDQGWQMGLFLRRRRALDGLKRHAILSDVLRNPQSRHRHITPIPLHLPFQNWSEEKTQLVSHTMTTAPLFLVQGPPGTGKTTYVAGLMQHILSRAEDPQARILVAAHMHFAIDHLAARVKERFQTSGDADISPIILRLSSGTRRDSRADLREQARLLFESCCKRLRCKSSDPLFLRIADAIARELDSDLTDEFVALITDSASIILTTCTDKCLDELNGASFDWVIVEEAGRVVGCDLVIPMRLGHRWVLIGDPKQLGPYRKQDFRTVVNRLVSEAVAREELEPDQQDRLADDSEHLLGPFDSFFSGTPSDARMMLKQQHRMHPDICRVVSHAFYQDDLVDAPEVDKTYLFGSDHPQFGNRSVLWIDIPHLHWANGVSTEDATEPNGYSVHNAAELEVTRRLLVLLTDEWSNAQKRQPADRPYEISAIAPYRYQVRRLRSLLQHWRFPDGLKPGPRPAATATAFQGQEAEIIILNLVRNNTRYDIGFLDAEQMNVALSRAQRLLIVIGCFEMLRKAAESNDEELKFCGRLVDALQPHVIPATTLFPGVAQ